MLDVDGHVLPSEELVRRVEELVAAARDGSGPVEAGAAIGLAPGTLEDQVHAVRALQGAVQPPEVVRQPGPRGWLAWAVKRAVRKLSSWYVEPRWAVQRDFDVRTAEFATQTFNELRRISREVEAMRRQQLAHRLQLITAFDRAQRQQVDMDRVLTEVSQRNRELNEVLELRLAEAAAQEDIDQIRRELGVVLERLGAASGAGPDIDYVEFENRFRGDSDALRENQRRYLSLFPAPGAPGRILDVGCGRGEMLELLRDAGHDAFGIDTDQGMVETCQQKGLAVVCDNADHFLERLVDGSLKGVFSAQVVEHLLVSELQRFVRLSFAKLSSGGALVIETINPRSSFALGEHFYADPSHVRPVHPETLRFICEQTGFAMVQLEERSPHPAIDLIGNPEPGDHLTDTVGALLRSVFGYQDYVIVATK